MLDTPTDPLDPVADPPDDQPGGKTTGTSSSGTTSKSDPPDDQPGGTG